MKVVLLGSPQFVIPTFEAVRQNFNVVAVITQPPRPRGRGLKLSPTPVADWARSHNLPLYEPEKIGTLYEALKALNYDLMLTFAFGQWIPPRVLALGHYLPLNIHGSLLPKYRGAAPVQHAVLNGDAEIGITLMEMVSEMDAGPMLFKAKVPLSHSTTASAATHLIANLATEHIVPWLHAVEAKKFKLEAQGERFSLAPKFTPEFAELKATDSCDFNYRKILALSEVPGAFIMHLGIRFKVYQARREVTPQALVVPCRDGFLYATDYQAENKKRIKLL